MEELDCSSKELADSSGLSAATISRYRSGERIPDVESDNLKQLIYGIVKLAQKRNLSSINDITVHSDFLRFLPDISADFSILQANLNTLFTMLSINTSEFARFRKCQVFLQHFFKKIFNIVYLLFIIYNDIIRLQLQLFLSSFLKKCIEKRLSSGSHFLYAPLSFILLIFPFH